MKCRRTACQNEVGQIPGSHRQRAYCSDRCRVNDFKEKKRLAELEQQRLDELARQRARWDRLTEAHSDLLPEQIELLFDHEMSIPKGDVIQAFAHLFEYASATFEQRKAIIRGKFMELGEELQYPALSGVGNGIAAGDEWWHRFAITRRGDELFQAYREVYYHYRLHRLEQERQEQVQKAEEERQKWATYYSNRY